jgi:hypothetical protein
MAGKIDSTAHAAAFARVSEAVKHESEILAHLEQIIKGSAFKGSHRSRDFLKHIVEQALHGNPADLRERSIGVALFNRPAAYDTADDAIVRVTASDVRKRLLQHYGNGGSDSRVRITLPPGSYIPEFSFVPLPAPVLIPPPSAEPAIDAEPTKPASAAPSSRWRTKWALGALLVLVLALVIGWLAIRGVLESSARQSLILAAFQSSPRNAQVVVSDDALVLIQVLLGHKFT